MSLVKTILTKIRFNNGSQPALNDTNLNQMQTNIQTAISSLETNIDVEIGKIIESGSNSNGKYIKLSDGTMICTVAKDMSFATYSQDGSIFFYDINNILFPVAFETLYSVNALYNSKKAGDLPWLSCLNATASEIGRIRLYNYYNAENSTGTLFVTAFGKWK